MSDLYAFLFLPLMFFNVPYTAQTSWQRPTVKGVTEKIIECEKNAEYDKLGLRPVPAKYWDFDKINGFKKHEITYETIDKKLADMQTELANIREELRALRSKK